MFDPVLLRTFLAVAETGSFTAAGLRLGLSQPTVSQHVARLERAAGRRLVLRDSRRCRSTDDGDAMAGFARSILAAHAEAESWFSGAATRGRLRFGAADDLAVTQLPRILRHFRRLHPDIDLELTVSQNGPLRRRLSAGHLDLIFVKQAAGESDEGRLVGRDALVWVGRDELVLDPARPLPLVAYQAPSLSRQLALAALEQVGRTWRVTCDTRDVSGLLAAVRAGLGVAAFPASLIPGDLVKVSERWFLPPLGDVEYVLHDDPRAPREAVSALVDAIVSRGVAPAV